MALAAPSSTLTGQTIADSYDQVLFLDSAAGVTEATLKIVSGTAGKTALSISDEHVLVKGVDTNNAAGFEVQQTDGTSILKVAAGTPSVLVSGSGVKLYFSDAGGEYISGDGTDLTIAAGTALNITADVIDLSDATKDVTLNAAVDALNFDSNTLSIDASNNRVGIGTASPSVPLDVVGTLKVGAASGGRYFNLINDSANSYLDVSHGLVVRTNGASSLVSSMFISTAGNVGIGTAIPDSNTALDVVGVIRASGGIQPNGNAYSASEVLDDYEEGTFTFQFYDAVSGGNASATTNTGHYTKIGNVVVARVYAYNNPSTSGMTSGNVLYFTLPFTAGANGYTTGACIVRGVDLNSRTSIATDLRGSASRGTFQTIGDGLDMANVLVSHWTSGSDDLNMLTLTYAT